MRVLLPLLVSLDLTRRNFQTSHPITTLSLSTITSTLTQTITLLESLYVRNFQPPRVCVTSTLFLARFCENGWKFFVWSPSSPRFFWRDVFWSSQRWVVVAWWGGYLNPWLYPIFLTSWLSDCGIWQSSWNFTKFRGCWDWTVISSFELSGSGTESYWAIWHHTLSYYTQFQVSHRRRHQHQLGWQYHHLRTTLSSKRSWWRCDLGSRPFRSLPCRRHFPVGRWWILRFWISGYVIIFDTTPSFHCRWHPSVIQVVTSRFWTWNFWFDEKRWKWTIWRFRHRFYRIFALASWWSLWYRPIEFYSRIQSTTFVILLFFIHVRRLFWIWRLWFILASRHWRHWIIWCISSRNAFNVHPRSSSSTWS